MACIWDWFKSQRAERELRESVMRRDSEAADLQKLYNEEMKKVEEESRLEGRGNPYDVAMAKYYRQIDIQRNPQKYPQITEKSNALNKLREEVVAGVENMKELRGDDFSLGDMFKKDKSRSIGAWIGRFFYGHKTGHDHKAGEKSLKSCKDFERSETDIKKDVFWLSRREKDIRENTTSVNAVIKQVRKNEKKMIEEEMAKPGEGLIRGGAAMGMRALDAYQRFESDYGPSSIEERKEKAKIVEDFRVEAQRRASDLHIKTGEHDRDFFPQFYNGTKMVDDAKIDEESKKLEINGAKKMDRYGDRAALGRMYMLSKGDSMDQIFGNTPENQALRRSRGREVEEILKSNPENIGKMYAEIGKAFADFPIPDMTSDLALSKNMRDIKFIEEVVGCMYEKSPGDDPIDNAYKKNLSPDDAKRIEAALMMGLAIYQNGVTDRINLMHAGAYSLAPELCGTNLNKQGVQKPSWPLALHYGKRISQISENFVPDTKIGDSKNAEYVQKESLDSMANGPALRVGQEQQVFYNEFVDSLTTDAIMEIKNRVVSAPQEKGGEIVSINFDKLDDKAVNPSLISANENQRSEPVISAVAKETSNSMGN